MIQITNVKIYEDLSKNELLNMIIKKYKLNTVNKKMRE